jgi:uncharacterized membrane protein
MSEWLKRYWWLALFLLGLAWLWWEKRKQYAAWLAGQAAGQAAMGTASGAAAATAGPSNGPQGGYAGPTAILASGYESEADYLAASPAVIALLNAVTYIHPSQGDTDVPLYQAFLNIRQNASDTDDVRVQMRRRLEVTA